MKRWFPPLVLVLASMAALHADTVQEVYARGYRAYISGDFATAKVLLAQVLEADPKNRPAAACLRQIELSQTANASLQKKTEALMVPKVDFEDASLNAIFDYLPKLAAQQKGTLNIVRMYPKDYGDEKKVTLQLTNVPMASVLDYITQIGGLKLEYQKNAIVVSLPAADKVAPAIQPQQ